MTLITNNHAQPAINFACERRVLEGPQVRRIR